jgi:hypothetical protein
MTERQFDRRPEDELERELEREIATALRRLPTPRAPQGFLLRVLEATTLASSRPWYARQWAAWPGEHRLVAAALLSAVLAGLAFWWPVPDVTTRMGATLANRLPAAMVEALARTEALIVTGSVLWEALAVPLASVVAPIVLVMGVASVVFGAALRHVVLGGTSHR